ncbi:MAG: hypothetical protein K9M96_18265 [Deltaproteobacteria bacterium]|nr:hypothetical protein [Deltaproteobacteria bacterium]
MKLEKVIDLKAYREKRFSYNPDTGVEWLRPGNPRYVGRYTLPAPCDAAQKSDQVKEG